uniref:Uncharacterized protein n=1 Tax=viral metagenome TaxID=1070528 RepID=A0A6M3LAF5_9ZZZZ
MNKYYIDRFTYPIFHIQQTYDSKDLCQADGKFHCITIKENSATCGPRYVNVCIKCYMTLGPNCQDEKNK